MTQRGISGTQPASAHPVHVLYAKLDALPADQYPAGVIRIWEHPQDTTQVSSLVIQDSGTWYETGHCHRGRLTGS